MKRIMLISLFICLIVIINPLVLSCTVFHVSNEEFCFGGNNEDYNIEDTFIYFYPSTNTSYAKVIVGYSGLYKIQGGMNEKGVFWDGLAAPYLEVKNSTEKPYFNGHIIDYILDTCETCQDALDILSQYNMKIFERSQILIGDKYGDSFIIEGDIILQKSEYYQVATNFYLSQYPNPPYPCWRYNTALLLFQNNPLENLSVEFCASVLNAVHQEGAYPTQYSTVYDLKNGLIYLYYYHNYHTVKMFNLTEETKSGYHSYSIPGLFKQDSQRPLQPTIPSGPNSGTIHRAYTYNSVTTDPEKDPVYYLFDWGDESEETWLGPFESGETCQVDHTWITEGNYHVRVKAKEIHGLESNWSDILEISMPRSKPHITLLEEHFPYLLHLFSFL